MGVELATDPWARDAGQGDARDRVGTSERTSSTLLGFGKHPSRVWLVAVGGRCRTRARSDGWRRLHLARGWNPTMSSRGTPVVERTASGELFYPTSRLRGPSGQLSRMFPPRAVSGARGQRK